MPKIFADPRSALAMLLSVAILGAAAQRSVAETRTPHILFILADDMGWTDASCYGSDLYETPHIDALAAQGLRFTDAYAACHVCSPTRAAIMTGKYPARLHLTAHIPGSEDHWLRSPDWTKYLPLEEVTIAEALAAQGYVCGHFGKWHLNKDKEYQPGRPMDPGSQGFDAVLTTHKPKSTDSPTGDPHHVREITDAALKFIDEQVRADQPFFCYVTHNTLHRPVIGHPDLVERYAKKIRPGMHDDNPIYAAMVHDLDQSVRRLLVQLDELGIADETLVVFTSDNGGFEGDEKDDGTSNYPLRAGKGRNYEGGVRVPTIIRWPGVTSAGTVTDEPIISMDFYPTLLAAAGLDDAAMAREEMDGINIVPLLTNPDAELPREALFWHYPHYHGQGATPHGAVRVGDWKLIEFFEDMHVELYNLRRDIGEHQDLVLQMPEKAIALRDRLHQWREEVGAQMPIRPE